MRLTLLTNTNARGVELVSVSGALNGPINVADCSFEAVGTVCVVSLTFVCDVLNVVLLVKEENGRKSGVQVCLSIHGRRGTVQAQGKRR